MRFAAVEPAREFDVPGETARPASRRGADRERTNEGYKGALTVAFDARRSIPYAEGAPGSTAEPRGSANIWFASAFRASIRASTGPRSRRVVRGPAHSELLNPSARIHSAPGSCSRRPVKPDTLLPGD